MVAPTEAGRDGVIGVAMQLPRVRRGVAEPRQRGAPGRAVLPRQGRALRRPSVRRRPRPHPRRASTTSCTPRASTPSAPTSPDGAGQRQLRVPSSAWARASSPSLGSCVPKNTRTSRRWFPRARSEDVLRDVHRRLSLPALVTPELRQPIGQPPACRQRGPWTRLLVAGGDDHDARRGQPAQRDIREHARRIAQRRGRCLGGRDATHRDRSDGPAGRRRQTRHRRSGRGCRSHLRGRLRRAAVASGREHHGENDDDAGASHLPSLRRTTAAASGGPPVSRRAGGRPRGHARRRRRGCGPGAWPRRAPGRPARRAPRRRGRRPGTWRCRPMR